MPDTLTKLFDDFKKNVPEPTEFQLFQSGFTSGAVSMRSRAVAAIENKPAFNDVKNKIGSLSDIP